MRAAGILLLGALAACEIGFPEGRFACAADGDCPGDFSCRTDGFCYATPDEDRSEEGAEPTRDAGPEERDDVDGSRPPGDEDASMPLPGADGGEMLPDAGDGDASMPERIEMLRDLVPGEAGSYANRFTAAGDSIYFWAGVAGLWTTDGTSEGTVVLDYVDNLFNILEFGDKLYFTGIKGEQRGLWTNDGTTFGSQLVVPLSEAQTSFTSLIVDGDRLWIRSASSDGTEPGIWVSDGTSGGTQQIFDAFDAAYATLVGHTLFFFRDDSGIRELWRSDGTAASTRRVMTIDASLVSNAKATSAGGKLFFRTHEFSEQSAHLWVSDGTLEGTQRIAELPADTNLMEMVRFGDRVLLSIMLGDTAGVWVSDGTAQGTQRVFTGEASSLNVLGERGYFISGRFLWSTGGSPENTAQVATFSKTLNGVGALGGLLMLSADDGSGVEPWLFDPELGSASLIADVYPGPESSRPWSFGHAHGLFFFAANDGVHGYEPWVYRRAR
jgi:ELWxxDGT repeat protein